MEALFNNDKYKWEKDGGAGWEGVQEDSEGNIIAYVSSNKDKSHKTRPKRITSSIRRGLIRYLVIAIDYSISALEKDFRPTRLDAIKSSLKQFIPQYYDENPISQLSLIITRDKIAEKLTELSGNPKYHENILLNNTTNTNNNTLTPYGEPSLQNILLLAISILRTVPEYGTREVLILYNSTKTRDPSNIFDTIQLAITYKIRINIICTSSELYICKKIAEDTGGMFYVASDSAHLNELVLGQVQPPPDMKSSSSYSTDFVYIG